MNRLFRETKGSIADLLKALDDPSMASGEGDVVTPTMLAAIAKEIKSDATKVGILSSTDTRVAAFTPLLAETVQHLSTLVACGKSICSGVDGQGAVDVLKSMVEKRISATLRAVDNLLVSAEELINMGDDDTEKVNKQVGKVWEETEKIQTLPCNNYDATKQHLLQNARVINDAITESKDIKQTTANADDAHDDGDDDAEFDQVNVALDSTQFNWLQHCVKLLQLTHDVIKRGGVFVGLACDTAKNSSNSNHFKFLQLVCDRSKPLAPLCDDTVCMFYESPVEREGVATAFDALGGAVGALLSVLRGEGSPLRTVKGFGEWVEATEKTLETLRAGVCW